MAETITLGKVSVSPKGAYSSTASYTFLDAVSHNGGAFLCLQNSTGVEPGVSSGWQSYWMETSKGIKQISISSAQEGQATITVTLSDGTVSTATFDTGVVVAQTGEGPPTTSTVAAYVGQLYVDTTATENPAYICVGITTADNVTTYVWQPVGGTIEDGSITADMLADDAIPDALGYNPGMVNPNLIDNWYFVGGGSQQGGGQFPINQRAQTSYSSSSGWTGVYSVDRWKVTLGSFDVSTGEFESLVVGGRFGQLIENPSALSDKTVTLSYLGAGNDDIIMSIVADGTHVAEIELPTEFNLTTLTVKLPNISNTLEVRIRAEAANLKFQPTAAKLELGSEQTLARQVDGVWVLNEIPDYYLEWTKCRWYYRKYILLIGSIFYPNAVDTGIHADDMRVPPAVSCEGVALPGTSMTAVKQYNSRQWETIWLDMPVGSFPTMGVGVYIYALELISDL